MGVEYIHFLVPETRTHRPDDAAAGRLVEALRAGRWIPAGESGAMRWEIDDDRTAGLRYPFVGELETYDARYYTIELRRSDDFVYHASECVDPFDDTTCTCGEELSYDTDDDQRIYAKCPACGETVDPAVWSAVVRDGLTGAERAVAGGATHRFALVVDCGKSLPWRRRTGSLDPELVATCERSLGCRLIEIGDYY